MKLLDVDKQNVREFNQVLKEGLNTGTILARVEDIKVMIELAYNLDYYLNYFINSVNIPKDEI